MEVNRLIWFGNESGMRSNAKVKSYQLEGLERSTMLKIGIERKTLSINTQTNSPSLVLLPCLHSVNVTQLSTLGKANSEMNGVISQK
jgi:hypothetical protein